jgi:hypothetical protein
MAKRTGPLDLLFLAFATAAMAAFVASELKVVPNADGSPVPYEFVPTLVNFLAIAALGFGMASGIGARSVGAVGLLLAALLGSLIGADSLGFFHARWMERFYEIAYPKTFPYGFLIFVSLSFVLAVAHIVRRRGARERVPRLFFLGCYGLNGVNLVLSAGLMPRRHPDPTYVAVQLLFLVPPTIAFLVLLYRMWAEVQDGTARTSAAGAVGRLFIPFYGAYWIFVVLPGYATTYNAYVERHGLQLRPLRRGPITASVIASLVGPIPALVLSIAAGPLAGFAVSAAILCLGRYVFGNICTAVNALAAAKADDDATAASGARS